MGMRQNRGEAVSQDTAARSLSGNEEAVWRELMRLLIVLPRALDADMADAGGLSSSEYVFLVALSEAPGRAMRMVDLAARSRLTQSGATRVVARLCQAGLVTRRPSQYDGRGQVAVLTDAGLAQLEAAYPTHLASARRLVFDGLESTDLEALAGALRRIAPDEPIDRPTDRVRP